LNDLGVTNIIRKDLENIKQIFCSSEGSEEMLSFIMKLQGMDCEVRYRVDHQNKITCVFFIHINGIEEARRFPECIVLDATYKTNSHKMVLLNFVLAGTVCGKEKRNQLTTVPIAGCWMSKEKEEDYTWALEQFRELVWGAQEDCELPSVFVTDNDRALRNSLSVVFPESSTLLCYIHVKRNFEKKFLSCMPASVKASRTLHIVYIITLQYNTY
jgi:hypothetical protein